MLRPTTINEFALYCLIIVINYGFHYGSHKTIPGFIKFSKTYNLTVQVRRMMFAQFQIEKQVSPTYKIISCHLLEH